MSIKEAYYYLYYKIYKTWSKNYNPLLSNNFKADISLMALKIWFLGTIGMYVSIILNIDLSQLSMTSPFVILSLLLALGSTLYFFTFSDKWKPYFEEFEKWPKRKNSVGGIIVWSIVIFIFLNFIISVELSKKLNG